MWNQKSSEQQNVVLREGATSAATSDHHRHQPYQLDNNKKDYQVNETSDSGFHSGPQNYSSSDFGIDSATDLSNSGLHQQVHHPQQTVLSSQQQQQTSYTTDSGFIQDHESDYGHSNSDLKQPDTGMILLKDVKIEDSFCNLSISGQVNNLNNSKNAHQKQMLYTLGQVCFQPDEDGDT